MRCLSVRSCLTLSRYDLTHKKDNRMLADVFSSNISDDTWKQWGCSVLLPTAVPSVWLDFMRFVAPLACELLFQSTKTDTADYSAIPLERGIVSNRKFWGINNTSTERVFKFVPSGQSSFRISNCSFISIACRNGDRHLYPKGAYRPQFQMH